MPRPNPAVSAREAFSRRQRVNGQRFKEVSQTVPVLIRGIEPSRVVVFVQQHRHPVVHVARQLVRIRRDDRARLNRRLRLVVRSPPLLPQSCECEWLTAVDLVEIWLLQLSNLEPLVVAISDDQAAPLFQRRAERWLGRDRVLDLAARRRLWFLFSGRAPRAVR